MQDVTAAKMPVRLSNGDIVIVSPFTNRDLLSLFKLVQKKYLAKMVDAIPRDLNSEQYRAAYAEALQVSKGFSIDKVGELIAELADIDIMAMVFQFAIQKDYNGDVAKRVDQILDNQEDYLAVMKAINGMASTKEEINNTGDEALPPVNVQP